MSDTSIDINVIEVPAEGSPALEEIEAARELVREALKGASEAARAQQESFAAFTKANGGRSKSTLEERLEISARRERDVAADAAAHKRLDEAIAAARKVGLPSPLDNPDAYSRTPAGEAKRRATQLATPQQFTGEKEGKQPPSGPTHAIGPEEIFGKTDRESFLKKLEEVDPKLGAIFRRADELREKLPEWRHGVTAKNFKKWGDSVEEAIVNRYDEEREQAADRQQKALDDADRQVEKFKEKQRQRELNAARKRAAELARAQAAAEKAGLPPLPGGSGGGDQPPADPPAPGDQDDDEQQPNGRSRAAMLARRFSVRRARILAARAIGPRGRSLLRGAGRMAGRMARGAGRMARGAIGRMGGMVVRAAGAILARLAGPIGIAVGGLLVLKRVTDELADRWRAWMKDLAEQRRGVSPVIATQLAINETRLMIERMQMVNQGFGRHNATDRIAAQAEREGELERRRQEAALVWDEVGVNVFGGVTAKLTELQIAFAEISTYTAKLVDWVTEDPLQFGWDIYDLLAQWVSDEAEARVKARRDQEKKEEQDRRVNAEMIKEGVKGNLRILFGPSPRENPQPEGKAGGGAEKPMFQFGWKLPQVPQGLV